MARAGGSALRHIRQRFELEAQAIATLRSPHTVALYDFGTSDDGSLYYAMELLDGVDGQTLVESYGPQPAGRVISILRQACDSLEEAHDAGMVHRDVKPTNLFVCRLGKQVDFVKLLDFGLVKALLGPNRHNSACRARRRHAAFMAPEQVRGEADIDGRGHIRQAASPITFNRRTGFRRESAMATALAHVEQPPVPPSRRSELAIPASLERVVMACLEKKRDRRPQSVAALAGLLEDCADVPPWTAADAKEWWALHRPKGVAA